jgi:hypothetical protein
VYAVQVVVVVCRISRHPIAATGLLKLTLPHVKEVAPTAELSADNKVSVPGVKEYSEAIIAAIAAVPVDQVAVNVSVPPVVITL